MLYHDTSAIDAFNFNADSLVNGLPDLPYHDRLVEKDFKMDFLLRQ